MRATEIRGAVEVALRVPDQTCVGKCPVRPPGKTIQHGLVASVVNLEHRSVAGRASGYVSSLNTIPELEEPPFVVP